MLQKITWLDVTDGHVYVMGCGYGYVLEKVIQAKGPFLLDFYRKK